MFMGSQSLAGLYVYPCVCMCMWVWVEVEVWKRTEDRIELTVKLVAELNIFFLSLLENRGLPIMYIYTYIQRRILWWYTFILFSFLTDGWWISNEARWREPFRNCGSGKRRKSGGIIKLFCSQRTPCLLREMPMHSFRNRWHWDKWKFFSSSTFTSSPSPSPSSS